MFYQSRTAVFLNLCCSFKRSKPALGFLGDMLFTSGLPLARATTRPKQRAKRIKVPLEMAEENEDEIPGEIKMI